MIGRVVMEVGEQEMIAMVEFYLNHSVFHVEGYPSREGHRARVVEVRQRGRGRFVIDFDGVAEAPEQDTGSDDIS